MALRRVCQLDGSGECHQDLQKAANQCCDILLATDPDREGEAISWHLSKLLDVNPEDKVRIAFHEITPPAIREAIQDPEPIDLDRVDAQQARRVLDRLVGYKLSPWLWRQVYRGLSAGRVQSVATRLICEREEEIRAFVPVEYWSIEAMYKTEKKESFKAKLTQIDRKDAELHNGKRRMLRSKESRGKRLKSPLSRSPESSARQSRPTPPPPCSRMQSIS